MNKTDTTGRIPKGRTVLSNRTAGHVWLYYAPRPPMLSETSTIVELDEISKEA